VGSGGQPGIEGLLNRVKNRRPELRAAPDPAPFCSNLDVKKSQKTGVGLDRSCPEKEPRRRSEKKTCREDAFDRGWPIR